VCTLIAIHRTVPGRWLVVAANRDEFLDRPAEAPALRTGQGVPLIAPLDVRAGGTWLGLNGKGVFAALTNLRDSNPDPARESRGQVVMNCLERSSAVAAMEGLMAIEPGIHNPFNAYVADQEKAFLVVYQEKPSFQELGPGVHVVGNLDPRIPSRGKGAKSKVERVREEAEEISNLPAEGVIEALGELCRSHGSRSSALDDICVHVGDEYGTRSSILLELSESFLGQESIQKSRKKGGLGYPVRSEGVDGGRFLYAEGPPCVAPFEDFSPLLEELRQAPGYAPAEISRGI